MSVAGLFLDICVSLLLSATIAYCWILNRRIKILQDSKSELAQLLSHFDESTQRASESIIALQTASKKIGENIQFRIDKANYLLEDLSFMIDKGNKLVGQIEASLAVSRAQSKAMAEQRMPEEDVQERPEPVQEMYVEKAPQKAESLMTNREKTAASLEAVLERVVSRNKFHTEVQEEKAPPVQQRAPQQQRTPQQQRMRSKAEQELLEMIRVGIKG